jgi:hypothetical protein
MSGIGLQKGDLFDGGIYIAGKFIESSTGEAYDALAKGPNQECSSAAA